MSKHDEVIPKIMEVWIKLLFVGSVKDLRREVMVEGIYGLDV